VVEKYYIFIHLQPTQLSCCHKDTDSGLRLSASVFSPSAAQISGTRFLARSARNLHSAFCRALRTYLFVSAKHVTWVLLLYY